MHLKKKGRQSVASPTQASENEIPDECGLKCKKPPWQPEEQQTLANSHHRCDESHEARESRSSSSPVPRGSDEAELYCETERCLGQCPYRELRSIRFRMTHDSIILEGTVSEFFLKQMAQEIVRPVIGSRKIENRIVVSMS